MPPLPKPPGARRRRNAGQVNWLTLPAGQDREVPALPLEDPHPSTVTAWQRAWESPMAAMWLAADVQGLARWATMLDTFYKGRATAALLREITKHEDRYGLSPAARVRLRWIVERLEDQGPQDGPPAPVRKLRAV